MPFGTKLDNYSEQVKQRDAERERSAQDARARNDAAQRYNDNYRGKENKK
jgi:hypothetical protein